VSASVSASSSDSKTYILPPRPHADDQLRWPEHYVTLCRDTTNPLFRGNWTAMVRHFKHEAARGRPVSAVQDKDFRLLMHHVIKGAPDVYHKIREQVKHVAAQLRIDHESISPNDPRAAWLKRVNQRANAVVLAEIFKSPLSNIASSELKNVQIDVDVISKNAIARAKASFRPGIASAKRPRSE
jgi:hypothetical protein